MLRISGGNVKGLTLESRKGNKSRPTQHSIREAIFNVIVNEIADASFLDIFAGNGTVGIEALSRGARSCHFIEVNRTCTDIIKRNLRKARLCENATVLTASALKGIAILESKNVSIDVVFSGAPYERDYTPATLQRLARSTILNPNAIVIVDVRKSEPLNEQYGNLIQFKSRTRGDTKLCFYQLEGS